MKQLLNFKYDLISLYCGFVFYEYESSYAFECHLKIWYDSYSIILNTLSIFEKMLFRDSLQEINLGKNKEIALNLNFI